MSVDIIRRGLWQKGMLYWAGIDQLMKMSENSRATDKKLLDKNKRVLAQELKHMLKILMNDFYLFSAKNLVGFA